MNKIQAFIRLNKWLTRIAIHRSIRSDVYQSTLFQMNNIWKDLSEDERDIIRNYYVEK